jgi:hypothetical protein
MQRVSPGVVMELPLRMSSLVLGCTGPNLPPKMGLANDSLSALKWSTQQATALSSGASTLLTDAAYRLYS